MIIMSFNEFSQSVCVCIIQLKSEVINWATTGRETKKIHPKFLIDFSSEPSLIKRKEMKQKKSLKQKKRFPFQALDQRQRRSKIEWIVFLMELRIVDRSDFVSLAVQMINI